MRSREEGDDQERVRGLRVRYSMRRGSCEEGPFLVITSCFVCKFPFSHRNFLFCLASEEIPEVDHVEGTLLQQAMTIFMHDFHRQLQLCDLQSSLSPLPHPLFVGEHWGLEGHEPSLLPFRVFNRELLLGILQIEKSLQVEDLPPSQSPFPYQPAVGLTCRYSCSDVYSNLILPPHSAIVIRT